MRERGVVSGFLSLPALRELHRDPFADPVEAEGHKVSGGLNRRRKGDSGVLAPYDHEELSRPQNGCFFRAATGCTTSDETACGRVCGARDWSTRAATPPASYRCFH